MRARPLTPEDRAILALESGAIAGHTCKVVRLGPGAPDTAALRERVAARLDAAPLLACRLGGTPDAPEWVPAERLDPTAHVVDAPVDAPLDRAGLAALVARLFSERLDRSRPLWRIDVVPLEGGGHALVWRIHHALADGTAALRAARALLWDPADEAQPHLAPPMGDEHAHRAHLLAFLHRELAPSRGPSPFGGAIGRRRAVAFASCSVGALHDAARRAAGATVNDAVLCVVAGAVRRWLARHGPAIGSLRVRVPVSLHPGASDDAANRDSFFSLAVPLREPDCAARLAAIRTATAVRKAQDDAREREAVAGGLGHVSHRLEHLYLHAEDTSHEFALAISNVPGPRTVPTVAGTPVEALHSLAEIGPHHALRVAAVSVGDRLGVGLCADADLVDDLPFMAAAVEAEAEALIAC